MEQAELQRQENDKQEQKLAALREQVEEKQTQLKEQTDRLTLAEQTLRTDKNEWQIQCAQRE